MTRALIIVESCFGNTRAIADSIAAGLIDGGVDAQVVDIDEAPSSLPADLDLLMLGAPTHNRGLPTTATRAKAHAQAGADGASQGISQWLGNAEIPASLSVAAFDTVISKNWLSGSAAKAIAKALRRHQGRGDDISGELRGHGEQRPAGRRPGERRPQLGTRARGLGEQHVATDSVATTARTSS